MNEKLTVQVQKVPTNGKHLLEVALEGELTFGCGADIEELALKGAGADATGVLLDMSGVSYVDSTGLGFLVGLSSKLAAGGVGFVLVGVKSRIEILLRSSNLWGLFLMKKTREEGLEYLRLENR